MYEIDSKTLDLIKKACKGKRNIKMTVGYYDGDSTVIKVFNENGEIKFEKPYIYEIGSITKTFTASLLAKYILEKKISLDDSINKFIYELDNNQHYPSLRRIVTHTAGYSTAYPLNRREYFKLFIDMIIGGKIQSVNPLVMNLDKMKLLVEKSRLEDKTYKWSYSNFGFALLGQVIAYVSGESYWNIMNDFIDKELGLKSTYLGTVKGKNLEGYNIRNKNCGNWDWNENNLVASAGALSSTAEDLLKYAKLNMFEEKTWLKLCHEKKADGTKKYDMGMAWWLLKKDNQVIMHGGGTGCFGSLLLIDKSKKISVVILSNYRLGMNSEENIGGALLEGLQKSKEYIKTGAKSNV